MMKRINRYAAVRLPVEIDFMYQHNKNVIKNNKTKVNRKIYSAIPIITTDGLILNCYYCHNKLDISDIHNSKCTYIRCRNCKNKNKVISKKMYEYYIAYSSDLYNFIKKKHEAIKQHRIVKNVDPMKYSNIDPKEPLITVVINEDGKEEIVTTITKKILEANDLTDKEKEVAIALQTTPEMVRLLRTLGVYYDELVYDCVFNQQKVRNQFRAEMKNGYNHKRGNKHEL